MTLLILTIFPCLGVHVKYLLPLNKPSLSPTAEETHTRQSDSVGNTLHCIAP